jgi:hypothetical protein
LVFAKVGCYDTLARVFIAPSGVFFQAYLTQTAWMKRNPRMMLPVLTCVSTIAVILGLYPAQAVFSQNAAIPASRLEPEFQGLKASDGTTISQFTFNKGL